MGIHQNPEPSSVHFTADGCPDDRLHRRHIGHSRVQEPSLRTLGSPSISSRMPGVHYQYREVCTASRLDHSFWVSLSTLSVWSYNYRMKQIQAESRWIMRMAESTSARTLAHLLCKMNSTAYVILPAPLFYQNLLMALSNTLENHSQDYEVLVFLPPASLKELKWWDTEMSKWNGKTLLKRGIDVIIDSDASLQGWGVH